MAKHSANKDDKATRAAHQVNIDNSAANPKQRSAAQPLWYQVKSSIVDLILRKRLIEHTRLPSEAELCEQFGVSRTVVREAMSQLVSDRMAYKIQGKGAFVACRRDEQDFLGTNVGFTSELHYKQRSVSRRILRQELAVAEPRAARMLQLSEDLSVVALDRVLSVDGVPRILVYTRLRADAVPSLEQIPMHNRSLYNTLSRQYGITVRWAQRWVEAVSATNEEAKLLDVREGTPLIAIESVAHGTKWDKPIEYYTALYRTDHDRLHFVVA